MNQPLITIAIATYNRAETLKYAVESILWQTYENYELWIIGDNCTDHTEEILQPFLNDPRVNWHNLPQNSGYQSVPNNEAIKRGSGKYIAYLNHDDLWLPNHLADAVGHLEKTESDFVFTILEWVYSFKESRPDIPLLPLMPRPPEATAVVHRHDVIERIGYWKDIHETYAYPRVEFFRDAYHAKMKFEIVPSLTALKFLWDEKNYNDEGPQELYIKRIKEEPDFQNQELSTMLVRSHVELSRLPNYRRFKDIIGDIIREKMVKINFDPARVKFWQKKGSRINIWQKRHRLKK
jgi:glycosyltransferase involved in cell wall biosynthesis